MKNVFKAIIYSYILLMGFLFLILNTYAQTHEKGIESNLHDAEAQVRVNSSEKDAKGALWDSKIGTIVNHYWH